MIGALCSLTCVVLYSYGGLELMKWIFCLVIFGVGLFLCDSQCHAQGGKSGPPTHFSIGDTFQLDLDYEDIEVGNQKQEGTAEIQLNQEVSRRYPQAEFGSYVIEKVVILAKSSDGNAQAELLLDLNSLTIKSIPKAQGSFLSKKPESYHQVELENPEDLDQGGAWEIQLRGHFIVHRAVLHLKVINENFGNFRVGSDSRVANPEGVPKPDPVREPETGPVIDPDLEIDRKEVAVPARTPKAASPPEVALPVEVPQRQNGRDSRVILVSVVSPNNQSRPYHEVSVDLGIDEIVGQARRQVSFRVNRNNIVGIKISGVVGSTDMIEVVAVLKDGSRRSLSELYGPILNGDERVVDLGFAIPIKEILVVSQGLGRSVGEVARYQLTVIQLQR